MGQLNEDNGQHVGHWVVASAFQFEHGAQVVFQVDLLRAQDGKDGSRIGGRHGGGQQQRRDKRKMDVGPAHARQPPDKEACKQGGEQHSYGGQDDTRSEYGLDFYELGVHTTGKQDDAEGNHANELGGFHVVELDAQTVTAEQHADNEEKQQGGNTETITGLSGQNTDEQQDGAYEQDIFRSKQHDSDFCGANIHLLSETFCFCGL